MIGIEPIPLEKTYSKESIQLQLQKVLRDSNFSESDVLKNFLSYIVTETLEGRSNRIKEYTIAVSALGKPVNFNPQESGIIRIHAGRLRRALNRYYDDRGRLDHIRISIPKGTYVPVFRDPKSMKDENHELSTNSPVLAVAPFQFSNRSIKKNSFADGLCVQLTTALMNLGQYSVVANYGIRNIMTKISDWNEICTELGAQFLITGDIQSLKDCCRIHVQMMSMLTRQLVWSHMYERKLSPNKTFELQDEIVRLVASEIGAMGV
jgi:TolB-like protein